MGIYILTAVYVWLLISLLTEGIHYFLSERFRELLNEAPILVTFIYMVFSIPLAIKSIVKFISRRLRKRRQDESQEDNGRD